MKFYALSDLHVDYEANTTWISKLSSFDYRDDVLLLPGDITHNLTKLSKTLEELAARFQRVLFVPGNHELWVAQERNSMTSIQKFEQVCRVVVESGGSMEPFTTHDVTVVPLLSWYDYSFGQPSPRLREIWTDFHACRWPDFADAPEVAAWFATLNRPPVTPMTATVISLSHFLPRRELVPLSSSGQQSYLAPVLGCAGLDERIRALRASIHIYGHSHVRRHRQIEGVTYLNNPLGYPDEHWLKDSRLVCVHEA